MATAAITAAQAEIISSLTQDEIPTKLRCAICRKLAVNTFRLPCCDQAICETCQSTLPESCPVCEHSPVTGEDCKPNKALRTTIKVFLRTEEKKREALRLKEAKLSTPPTTAPAVPAPVIDDAVAPTAAGAVTQSKSEEVNREEQTSVVDQEQTPVEEPAKDHVAAAATESTEADQDVPQPSIEEIIPGQESTEEGDVNQAGEDEEEEDEITIITEKRDTNGQSVPAQTPAFGTGFGFGAPAVGGFPAMGGDMQQQQMAMMQQMMAMQGIAPNAFGSFPMMGMGMDPMTMQPMMGGGFGAGMGMNGMNMGMGTMGGFDGNNAGFNNGWNGQQSWNVGQDNYNHPNAAGMGHGDYGSNNSGYPQSTGFNQGNYGRGNHYNDYQNSFGYRGRGRGRGGFVNGRGGGYGFGSNDAFAQQYPQSQNGPGQQPSAPVSDTAAILPAGRNTSAVPGDVDEFGREVRQTSETKAAEGGTSEVPKDDVAGNAEIVPTEDGDKAKVNGDAQDSSVPEDSAPKPIQTLDEVESYQQNNYHNGNYGNNYNQAYGGRGPGFGSMQPPIVKPVDVPINAPTGPKAMREGLPNTGWSGLKLGASGRPESIPGRRDLTPVVGNVSENGLTSQEVVSESRDRDRIKSPSLSRDRSKSRDRKRSRSRDRSRDRHRRKHRHRSASLTEDEKETERRRQRRKERRDAGRREDDGTNQDDHVAETKDDRRESRGDEQRSRSASPSDSKRSSHRSRREKDKYREQRDREDKYRERGDEKHRDRDDEKYRERDDDVDYKSSHKHRSSRRHHDERPRSRERSRERDREDRHRHSRRNSQAVVEEKASKTDTSLPPTPIEPEAPRRPSLMSNGANIIEIRGASTRKKASLAEAPKISIPTGPRTSASSNRDERPSRRHEDERRNRDKERAKEKERARAPAVSNAPAVQDPHTLEREARNRERLLKETQRIAALNGGGSKRGRDDGGEERKGRKKRGRGEESEEARIARLEAEREGERWA